MFYQIICDLVFGAFSWLMTDVGGPRLLRDVPSLVLVLYTLIKKAE